MFVVGFQNIFDRFNCSAENARSTSAQFHSTNNKNLEFSPSVRKIFLLPFVWACECQCEENHFVMIHHDASNNSIL